MATTKGSEMKLLQLTDIDTHSGTQIRATIDEATVAEYAAAWTDGAQFPPVVVFHDGHNFILADGFHRVLAAARNGFKDVEAEVHKGTRSDALKYALGANAAHGLKRTNADKRRSVELALGEWPQLSDRQIAEICAVSNNFVSERRGQLSSDDSCETPTARTGKDGKTRKLPKKREEAPEESEPETQEESTPHITTYEQEVAELKKLNIPTSELVANAEKIKHEKKSPLPKPLWEVCDVAYKSLRLVIDPEFVLDCDSFHEIASDVRKAAHELERYYRTTCGK